MKVSRATKYAFLLPAFLFFLILSIFPFFFTLGLSFTDFYFTEKTFRFVGLANWGTVFQDSRLLSSLITTSMFVGCGLCFEYGIALLLALKVDQIRKGKAFFRVVFVIPMILTPVAVGSMGRMMFHSTTGVVNLFLGSLGLLQPHWFSHPLWAKLMIILVDTWQGAPFIYIILLSGLQSIPIEAKEAARIDGASQWQLFRYIVFPLIFPVSVVVLMLRGMEIFKMFDYISVITAGGPGSATETLSYYAYWTGLKGFNLSYASAIGYSLFLVVVVFALIASIGLWKKTGGLLLK